MTCYTNANYLVTTTEPVKWLNNDCYGQVVLAEWFKEESEAKEKATEWLSRTTATMVAMFDLSCSRVHEFTLELREHQDQKSLQSQELGRGFSGSCGSATASKSSHGNPDAESEAR